MKVIQLFYFYDERLHDERAFIRQYYTTTGWSEALLAEGVQSRIVTRFGRDGYYEERGIQHHFCADKRGGNFRAWQVPWKLVRQVKQLDADVVQVHSLTLSLPTFVLRWMLPRKTAIIVQHHGGRSPGRIKRLLHNLLNSVADAFFFTTHEQGAEWFMRAAPYHKIMPVMEGATFFDYDTRDKAPILQPGGNSGGLKAETFRKNDGTVFTNRIAMRQLTGLSGAPVFLWVGRLDDNKDPLTILEGFAQVAAQHPQARLYMIYHEGVLEEAVRQRIQQHPTLQNSVHLLGRIGHEKMMNYYHSADYFILGSHHEGSGYALSEALRCGCVPIVTAIPSFRMMTDGGRLGAFWQPGDASSFVTAAGQAMRQPLQPTGEACMAWWHDQLSFEAIARVAAAHYRQVVAARQPFPTRRMALK
ncbi:glycosyltransferase family 4 protein [Paraflavitalea pollutisoli]|uniref:glycosyltransferase family 4 protein n=1 Tax=Paraflavitalea pollutisoli TaxID=3034143 RepID=UPI0023EB7D2A|nr:glycosyltransferase family 4 protein [Paraflavitalea sp. H1-2-19X]